MTKGTRTATRPPSTRPRRRLIAAGLLIACVLTAGVGAAASTSDGDQAVTIAKVMPLSEGRAVRLSLTTTTTIEPVPPLTAAPAPVVAAAASEPVAVEPPPAPVPEPAPEPAPAPPPPSGSVEEAIYAYFPDVYDQAVQVASCESGMDPGAVSSGGGNWGLFQINTVHRPRVESMGYAWEQLLDPYVNSHVARSIYDESGWRPWACRP